MIESVVGFFTEITKWAFIYKMFTELNYVHAIILVILALPVSLYFLHRSRLSWEWKIGRWVTAMILAFFLLVIFALIMLMLMDFYRQEISQRKTDIETGFPSYGGRSTFSETEMESMDDGE